MVTNEERAQRYGTPIAIGMANGVDEPTITRAVMAVANAEQAELRAEVGRSRKNAAHWQSLAEAAEAKVARVEALVDEWEASYGVSPLPDHWGVKTRIEEFHAALDGDA